MNSPQKQRRIFTPSGRFEGGWDTLPRSLIFGLLLFSPMGDLSTAIAKSTEVDVFSEIQQAHDNLVEKVEDLEFQVAPGRGFITATQAIERFQNYAYLHMIGDYEQAAEGFFTLVTTAALTDSGLHRDAEWYLAESLFLMGNLSTAEARYQVISDDMEHPFRDDAVRRLLELYANSGQTESFYAYYQQEIVKGRVNPSDQIRYAVAKAFFRAGDKEEAKKQLLTFEPGSPYFYKGRYFIGAILVDYGQLDEALNYFKAVLDLPVEKIEDRKLVDLANMAIARIKYEQGAFQEASEYYDAIGRDSDYLSEKLYELTWTFIKQGQIKLTDWRSATDDDVANRDAKSARNHFIEALRALDIFMLAYPDHELAAHLRVLQGHLHMLLASLSRGSGQEEHDKALQTYEQVIVDYTPIRRRFAELAQTDDPLALIQEEGTVSDSDLPPFAISMMMSDEELARSLNVYRELEHQRRNVEISEGLIVDLESVLGSSSGIGGFEQLRYDVLLAQSGVTEQQIRVTEVEENWLLARGGDDLSKAILGLRSEREELVLEAQAASNSREKRRTELQLTLKELHESSDSLMSEVQLLQEEGLKIRSALAAGAIEDDALKVEAERRWAEVEVVLSDAAQRLSVIRSEEVDLTDEAAAIGDVAGMMSRELERIRKQYRGYRTGVSGAGRSQELKDLDAMYGQLAALQVRLAAARTSIERTENTEMGRIRERFRFEVAEVEEQRRVLEQTSAEAREVSMSLTRAGFGRLEDFFAESVLKADMGIVDVYWAEKLEVDARMTDLKREKATLLADLDQRFGLIRQKLNQ